MKRRILGIFLGLGLVFSFLASPLVVHASTQDFTISSFATDYYLSRNDRKTSLMDVSETIVAQFPNFDQNHGILRAIPKTYKGNTLSLKIVSVANEHGQAYEYDSSNESGNLVLKIGDANKYVHGLVTYKIHYTMRNVASYFDDHDELYWDVNGDQWQQPVDSVTARIHIPTELATNLQDRQVCYAGAYGSMDQNCTIERSTTANETLITTSAENLQPYQTLSYVLGFNKGTFEPGPEIAAEKLRQKQIIIFNIVSFLLPPLIALAIMINRWHKYGRNPKGKGVIIPEYKPPKGFNILSSGFLLSETLPPKAISALIIDLAVRRYITIYETKTKKLIRTETSYEFELVKDPSDLSVEEKKVLDALFGSKLTVGAKVKVNELKNKLYKTVKETNDYIGKDLATKGFFASDPAKARKKYTGRGIALIVIGVVCAFTVVFTALGFSLAISGIIVLIASNLMPALTSTGVTIEEHLKGLKSYISLAEKDRLKYLQSPEGAEKVSAGGNDKQQKIKLFEDLLPYAILFGLEKDWAKQFEDIYTEPPDWYHGNWSTFNAVYLTSSINNMSAASTAAFSAPSSSGSSGFGGGGAGGGGGGGGGGGW